MALLGKYLDLERLRFSDRMETRIDMAEDCRDAAVPAMVLQPLVENAIKYAVAPREEGGTIAVQAKVTGRTLHLVMADDGPGLNGNGAPKKSSNGVGLANTRERLQQLYGDEHRFDLAANDPRGLLIRMDIPYEYEDSSTDR